MVVVDCMVSEMRGICVLKGGECMNEFFVICLLIFVKWASVIVMRCGVLWLVF